MSTTQDSGANATASPSLVESIQSTIASPMTSTWQDRRGMFQRGREVHEPGNPVNRRTSGAGLADSIRRSSTASQDGLKKTTSNASVEAPSSPTSSGQRRRSSNTSGLYANLMQHKRGSEDYGERRTSHSEHLPTGIMSGWYNSTFRGMAGAKPTPEEMQQKKRPGLMESDI